MITDEDAKRQLGARIGYINDIAKALNELEQDIGDNPPPSLDKAICTLQELFF